jgi:hypothetical protein
MQKPEGDKTENKNNGMKTEKENTDDVITLAYNDAKIASRVQVVLKLDNGFVKFKKTSTLPETAGILIRLCMSRGLEAELNQCCNRYGIEIKKVEDSTFAEKTKLKDFICEMIKDMSSRLLVRLKLYFMDTYIEDMDGKEFFTHRTGAGARSYHEFLSLREKYYEKIKRQPPKTE